MDQPVALPPVTLPPVTLPALLRHARTTYGAAMRRALDAAGYDDIPGNGLYLIGGLAIGDGIVPLGQLIRALNISKQSAGLLVDTLVTRGYLERTTDADDRRRLSITLTIRGQAAAEVQAAARQSIDDELVRRVGQADIDAARRTLISLIHIERDVEQGASAGNPEGAQARP